MNQMVSIVEPGAGNGAVIPPANQLDQHEKFLNELHTKQTNCTKNCLRCSTESWMIGPLQVAAAIKALYLFYE